MAININVEKLPRKVLKNPVKFNHTLKKIYITVDCVREPTTLKEIAKQLGYVRAYVHM